MLGRVAFPLFLNHLLQVGNGYGLSQKELLAEVVEVVVTAYKTYKLSLIHINFRWVAHKNATGSHILTFSKLEYYIFRTHSALYEK